VLPLGDAEAEDALNIHALAAYEAEWEEALPPYAEEWEEDFLGLGFGLGGFEP
jgi:hypothetical protein